jgi:hypothetical protein
MSVFGVALRVSVFGVNLGLATRSATTWIRRDCVAK